VITGSGIAILESDNDIMISYMQVLGFRVEQQFKQQ